MADDVALNQAVELVSASKSLERIADHATNIAEDVVYMVNGEIIRHGLGETEGEQGPDSGDGQRRSAS